MELKDLKVGDCVTVVRASDGRVLRTATINGIANGRIGADGSRFFRQTGKETRNVYGTMIRPATHEETATHELFELSKRIARACSFEACKSMEIDTLRQIAKLAGVG